MNAHNVLSRDHRTEIAEAQHAGSRMERQDKLIPDVPGPITRPASLDVRERRHCVRCGGQHQAHGKAGSRITVLGKQFVKRGDNFMRVALDACHALGEASEKLDWLLFQHKKHLEAHKLSCRWGTLGGDVCCGSGNLGYAPGQHPR